MKSLYKDNLDRRIEAMASTIEALELASEYLENGSNQSIAFWSVFTGLKFAMEGIMDDFSSLCQEMEGKP